MTLSNSKLKSLLNKSCDKRTELADRDGLGVRITTNGTITFQYRYRFNNKPMRLTLGRYPDLTLSQARDKIPSMRQMLWEGNNPLEELKKAKRPSGITLDSCIDLFLKRHVVKLRPKTQKLYKYTLQKHAKGAFTGPIESVSLAEWYDYFDGLEDNYSQVMAQDMVTRLKTCMRFSLRRGLIESTALLLIAPKDVGKKSEVGQRVLTISELRTIWSALDKSKCYPTTRNVIKFAILTGARLGEIRHMERSEINFESSTWTIPKEKSKMNIAFDRPLGRKAIEILKWQIDTFGSVTNYVFPSGSYKQHISSQTVNKLSRSVVKKTNMPKWSCHDFRRTLSTGLSLRKVELHVTEKMLGHSLGGALTIYNKYLWIEEQRLAYKLWEHALFEEEV